MEHRSRTQAEHRARAEHILRSAGGPTPAKAVHAHEKHLHKGEPMTKLASGGKVKKASHVTVNVIHGDEQAAQQRGMQQGVQQGVKLGAMQGAMGPRPPMGPPPGAGGPPPGGPPPGAGPMPGGPPMRPPGMKAGGAVLAQGKNAVPAPNRAGSGSAAGREEKAKDYGAKSLGGTELVKVKAHVRNRGGVC